MKKRMTVSGSCVLGAFAALAVSGAALADFQIYTDSGAFFAAIEQAGKMSKGFWDFKPNNVPPGFIASFDDPLNFITAPGTGIWDNMPLDNIQFQSNLNPQGEGGPNPRGAQGLAFATAPFFGINNNILVANTFVDSYDILSGVPKGDNHTAMAMNVVSVGSGGGDVIVTVWDKNEEHKTKWNLGANWQDNEKRFIGILAVDERSIGRVNIYDTSDGAEGISAIEVFVAGEPPQVGACCFDDGTCSIEGEADCLGLGGTYQGDGTSCEPNQCPPPPDCKEDLDGDGVVGVKDLLQLLGAWGLCPGGGECDGKVCGEFGDPCGLGKPLDCFCFTIDPAGSGACIMNFLCADVEPCVDGDCPPGFVCVFDSCCGDAVCVPNIGCDNGAAPWGDTTGSGPTGSGQFIEASQSAPTRPRDVGTTQGSDTLSGGR